MRSLVALFLVLLATTLSAAEPIEINVTPPAELTEEHTGVWRIAITNTTDQPINVSTLTLTFYNETLLSISPMFSCPPNPPFALYRCPMPVLPAHSTLEVVAEMKARFRYGRIVGVVSVEAPDVANANFVTDKTFWKDYRVSSPADSGPGSLRQAILDINAECDVPRNEYPPSCRALIDIERRIGGDFFHVITPLSPLPALAVPRSAIDASTEDQSNTLGPSVALDGSMLHVGNGLTVARGECDIKAIAIGNFPWNGIYAAGDARVNVDRAYIGVNALGFVPTPNGARGIASERVAGTITSSRIESNGRSGIFLAGPKGGGVEIRNNRIVRNGGSGIYIGEYQRNYQFTVIADNAIGLNAHFGVAVSMRALISFGPNSIGGNGGGALDFGLDGPTGAIDGIVGQGGIFPMPVITSATYENGKTTITGTVAPFRNIFGGTTVVDLYANSELDPDGYAEGEQYLGSVRLERDTFSFTIDRDLRGKYVNGLTHRTQAVPYDDVGESSVSEFGRAMQVQ